MIWKPRLGSGDQTPINPLPPLQTFAALFALVVFAIHLRPKSSGRTSNGGIGGPVIAAVGRQMLHVKRDGLAWMDALVRFETLLAVFTLLVKLRLVITQKLGVKDRKREIQGW